MEPSEKEAQRTMEPHGTRSEKEVLPSSRRPSIPMVPFVLQSSTASAVLDPCPYQNWVMLPSKTHSKSCKKINRQNNAIVAIISQHIILNLSALVLFVQRMFFWGDYFSAKCSVKISLSSHSFSLFLSSFCFFPYV